MKPTVTMNPDGRTISIFIPMDLKRRGRRKTMLSPDGQAINPDRVEEQDETLLSALTRSHQWNRKLTNGEVGSVTELAEQEGYKVCVYISRILRLAFLAPDIQEAILNSNHPSTLTLADLMQPFPVEWEEQRRLFGFG